MKKNIFKYVLVPAMILCAFGINFFKAQNWTTVWTENFNGLPYSSSYNNGVTGYWNNSVNPPQNSQINGTFEATPANGIVAGTTQVPSDASGGRFLMFWTQGGVAIPASENVFFKKTMTVVPGKTYRINYRFATLGAVPATATNRANTTFKVSPQGNTTSFYTSGMVVADVNAWKNVQYEFTVPSSVTSIDMTWENTTKSTTGNDFAMDDLVLQEAVDSDGDGIPDYIDDDDDNDGILDTAECGGGAIYNYSGFGIRTISATQANLIGLTGNTYTPTTIATNIIPGNDANHMTTDASRNRVLFANNIGQGSLFAYQFSTNTVVNVGSGFLSSLGDASGGAAMYNNDYFIYDDTGTTSQGLWRVTFNASGNASTLTKVVDPISGIDLGDIAINSSGMVYLIASTGALYKLDLSSLNLSITTPSSAWISVGTTGSASGTQLFFGANGDLIGSNNGNLIRIDPNNAANLGTISTLTSGYSWGDISEAPSVGFSCGTDTDSDGIPNNLDLDSDGDGCPDAREGAGNFNPTATASGTIASQTPNINFGTAVSATTGVPTAVGAGQPVGQSQDASKNDCLDSDGDNLPDWQDLDDDNDGILDTVECTPTYLVRPVTTSSVTANKPITVGNAQQIADGEGAGLSGAGPFPNWYTNVANLPISFSMNMQSSSTIDHIKLYGPWGFNEWIGNFTIELYNASNTLLGTENFAAPDQYTGTPMFSFTKEYTNVTSVRFTIVSSQGYSTVTPPRASLNEIVFLDLQPLTCDTDNDGIPNHLDLDSDGDGCPDAIEGAGNFNPTTIASGPIASQTPNINFGTAVDISTGVPTAVGAGQSVGQSQDASKNDCLDSDDDGVPNWRDLDDDNDGILDTSEECIGFRAQNSTGTWNGDTVSNLTAIFTGTSPQTNVQSLSDSQVNYYINQNGGQQRVSKSDNVSFSFSFSTPVKASEIAFYIEDLDPSIAAGSPTAQYTFLINGAPSTSFASMNIGGASPYLVYNAATGSISLSNSSNDHRILLKGIGNQLVSSITMTSTGVGSGDAVAYSLFAKKSCDTDNDSIPNYLDLDSDNDGCLDAMEGDENVTVNMLVNAASGLSVGTGSSASNQNLCTSGTCVNANGVPTQVNSGGAADIGGDVGQGIGDSQNALISSGCYCYKPEVVVAGNPNPVKHGITALNRANSGTSDWPIVRQSAWTVLESKTKGFVLNRMAFVDEDSNTATPTTPPLASIPAANYVEGMMVYDTVAKCLKIYNGTIWSCFSTQTCPD
ncbi:hypothetical protein LNP04_08225 [Chryseobacterium sp. C-71]|uniref:hypothetical protein n=1 Tax=Chryseobacterium sp. C-71 TaxID=2893882 RepID=UPI001E609395|nr:hypothetical protein [Chryseobacterium sp. C-71]UFH33676.1 hypothetical protein LNP04_08225 [Chryseobacterium sp. C-71]